MKKALQYAKKIIEAYQLEIRCSKDYEPLSRMESLEELGFCQGIIFTKALNDIEKLEKSDRNSR
jgi:hypothetical protein